MASPIRKCVDTCGKEVKPGDLIQICDDWSNHWAVYVGGGNVVHLVPHELWAGKGEVLKKKLEDVVKKDKWRVNNLLDNEYKPRPADDIVNKACSLMDTKMLYDPVIYNCQHFATEMRYGKPESQQVQDTLRAEAPVAAQGVMESPMGRVASLFLGVSSSSSSAAVISKYFDKDKKEIQPGDLTEFFRLGFKHWGVYVGNGNVVHFGAVELGAGKVMKDKLRDVKNDYRRVNNLLDGKHTPRPADDIVREACSLVDAVLKYHLFKYNCEHFANEMRYGEAVGQQVWNTAARIAVGGAVVAAGGVAAGAGAVVVAAGGAVAVAATGVAIAAARGAKTEKPVERHRALKTKSN